MQPIETKRLTFQTRFARRGSTVGMRLTVRETVAVDTLARLAISRMLIDAASTVPKRAEEALP